jgi:hypothetical protein
MVEVAVHAYHHRRLGRRIELSASGYGLYFSGHKEVLAAMRDAEKRLPDTPRRRLELIGRARALVIRLIQMGLSPWAVGEEAETLRRLWLSRENEAGAGRVWCGRACGGMLRLVLARSGAVC